MQNQKLETVEQKRAKIIKAFITRAKKLTKELNDTDELNDTEKDERINEVNSAFIVKLWATGMTNHEELQKTVDDAIDKAFE